MLQCDVQTVPIWGTGLDNALLGVGKIHHRPQRWKLFRAFIGSYSECDLAPKVKSF